MDYTVQKPNITQLNRALRIACEEHGHEIVKYLIGQGANDYAGALIVACRVNDILMVEFMCSLLHFVPVHRAFAAGCVSKNGSEAASLICS